MKISKMLIISGLILLAVTHDAIFATESQMFDEEASEQSSDDSSLPTIYDHKLANDSYREMAKKRDVPFEAISGQHFEPRWFWSQPIELILNVLKVTLKESGVIEEIESYNDGFAPKMGPHPEDMEINLEQNVFEIVKALAEKTGKTMISFADFVKSLNIDRENGDKFDFSEKRFKATPLITFFEPYF